MKNKTTSEAIPAPEAEPTASLPISVINMTLQYLASRPYSEVFEIITKIQQESKTL